MSEFLSALILFIRLLKLQSKKYLLIDIEFGIEIVFICISFYDVLESGIFRKITF